MDASQKTLRFVLVGCGRRAANVYVPLLGAFPNVQCVGAWSRTRANATSLAAAIGATADDNLERLLDTAQPDAAILSVNADANGPLALTLAARGLPLLLETPIAWNLHEADALVRHADAGLEIEVAEQFWKRPIEQLKRACIAAGLFGRVHTAFNDFEGHAYHGVSLLRSYLGFEATPRRVQSVLRRGPVRKRGGGEGNEELLHGLIEFDDNRTGVFHWSSEAYDSPVRGSLGGRFYGERGSWETIRDGATLHHHVRLIDAPDAGVHALEIRRQATSIAGGEVLAALHATVAGDSSPRVSWHNPLHDVQVAANAAWSDDQLATGLCLDSLIRAVREDRAPDYGAAQARIDQALTVALYWSAERGMPIPLPLTGY